MNKIIERYIYDVTRRLSEKERGEVRRELETSITDMLPDNPSEQDVTDVLTKLGSPRILSEQYRQNPRYLISPAMFELYISVLKAVVSIAAGVFACTGAFLSVSSGLIGDIIGSAVSAAFDGALQAAFWVTFGFVMAERYGSKPKLWEVSQLPQLPNQKGVKISRSSSITGIILSIFFTALLVTMIVREEMFFILVRGSEVINPFSQAALTRCIPYIFFLGGLSLLLNSLKLYWTRWNLPICIASIISNIVWASIAVYIAYWTDLFSNEFFALINYDFAQYILPNGRTIFFSVVFVAAVVDIGGAVWNTWKGMRKEF